MSYADHIFINMCKDIIENGTSTEGEKVRPKWEDGTSAYTIKQFGVVNRYDLSKEFPALTLRKTYIKSAIDELLWIWQKKSNNVNDLKSHIWDEWADEDGSIGKAYGYQMGVKHQYKEGMMDQVDRVIYDLKHNPYSRRITKSFHIWRFRFCSNGAISNKIFCSSLISFPCLCFPLFPSFPVPMQIVHFHCCAICDINLSNKEFPLWSP